MNRLLCRARSRCSRRFFSDVAIDAGQPTPETHPELLSAGEILPGISVSEFQQRREKLMSLVPDDSLVVIGSAPQKMMTDVVPYPYRPDSDYLYFTGCQQPGGIAVIRGKSDLCMFMPDHDPEHSAWHGPLADTATAANFFKASETFSMKDISKHMPSMINRAKHVYCNDNLLTPQFQKLSNIQEAFQQSKLRGLQRFSSEVRWIKSPAEIGLMRRSAEICSQAFIKTIQTSSASPHEHILAATMEYESKIRGAERMAFPPVVGGGPNGSVIHYSRNDQRIRKGDLVLMDAGCELHGYVSDITRTWPPCGTFSDAQREVYELVLKTMNECFRLCHPGTNLYQIHNHSVDVLSKGMLELGIIRSRGEYNNYNPTAIGHYLGMDVHDSAAMPKTETLRPGVVITVEPGLYFPNHSVPVRYQGLGIRIEDEVLITETGYEVLSATIPKTIEDLEQCIQGGRSSVHPLALLDSGARQSLG